MLLLCFQLLSSVQKSVYAGLIKVNLLKNLAKITNDILNITYTVFHQSLSKGANKKPLEMT